MMLDKARAGAEIKEEAKYLNRMATELRNRKMERIIRSRKGKKVDKLEKKKCKGHECELKFTSNDKKKACS